MTGQYPFSQRPTPQRPHRRLLQVDLLEVHRHLIGEQTTALRRFDREVRAAVRLNHANVARFYEANQFGRQQYYVMEYVNGIDLKGLVERTGFLPVEWAGEFRRFWDASYARLDTYLKQLNAGEKQP